MHERMHSSKCTRQQPTQTGKQHSCLQKEKKIYKKTPRNAFVIEAADVLVGERTFMTSRCCRLRLNQLLVADYRLPAAGCPFIERTLACDALRRLAIEWICCQINCG